jgi:endonuclease G, mitochondrial
LIATFPNRGSEDRRELALAYPLDLQDDLTQAVCSGDYPSIDTKPMVIWFSPPRLLSIAIFAAISDIIVSAASGEVSQAAADQGIVECTGVHVAKHNPGLAEDPDYLACFQAYISNFNTKPRQVRGKPRYLGVPRWVAHNIARAEQAPETNERPSSWFTVPELAQQGIAPTDDSYKFSANFRNRHKNWYERGHLAQKYLAERLGGTAGWFTHNVVNAVPQRSQFNKGPWLTLECFTGAWANKYGEVWVISGPIFTKSKPITWLRSDTKKQALPVAIPVSLFKIVMRKSPNGQWETLAFIYPQGHKTYRKGPFDPELWLQSVSEIERLTGEHFLSNLPNASSLKPRAASNIWTVAASDFDSGCKNQKTNVL